MDPIRAPSIERSTYVLLSSLVLILLYRQWQPLTQEIWSVSNPVGAVLLTALFWLHVVLLVSPIQHRQTLAWIMMFVLLMLALEHGVFGRLEARAFAWRNASLAQPPG